MNPVEIRIVELVGGMTLEQKDTIRKIARERSGGIAENFAVVQKIGWSLYDSGYGDAMKLPQYVKDYPTTVLHIISS